MFEADFRITAQVRSNAQGKRVFRITEREAPDSDMEFLSRLTMMYQQAVYTTLLPGDDLAVAVRLDLPFIQRDELNRFLRESPVRPKTTRESLQPRIKITYTPIFTGVQSSLG